MSDRHATKAGRARDTRGFGATPTSDGTLTRGEMQIATEIAAECRTYDGTNVFMLKMQRLARGRASWTPTTGQAKVITRIYRQEHRP